MKRNIIVVVFFLLALGILFSLPEKQTNALEGSIRDIFAVQQTGLLNAKERIKSVMSDKAALLLENRRLRMQNEELRNEIQRYKPLQEENQELRDLLKLKSASEYPLLAAELIARDVNGWWRMVRIDKGAEDGLKADLPVISPEGLVGQIAGVSPHTADVLLLTNPKLKIAARLRRADIFGIVCGKGVTWQGSAKYRMDFIMKDAEITRADEVITSGLGGVYPSGLVIGYVENVRMDSSGLFQNAEIIPAADFKSLDIVFVVLPERCPPENKAGERKPMPACPSSARERRPGRERP